MRRLVIICLLMLVPSLASGAWFDSNWLNRKKVTIDNTKVPGDLTDYIATVSLRDSDILGGARVDGRDIVFTDSDGSTQLSHYLQKRKQVSANGMWSWFSNPRAIYDSSADKTYWTGVKDGGDVLIYSYDHANGEIESFTLASALEDDDHDHGAVYVRTDGKILVAYGKHNADDLLRVRISTNAGDISAWGAETTLSVASGSDVVTYQNPIFLSETGRLYLFFRHKAADTSEFTWRFITSDDEGDTWDTSATSFWLGNPGGNSYCIFAHNDADRIDIFASDGHPTNDASVSLYHFFIRIDAGTLKYFESDGTEITASLPLGPSDVTQVYDGSTDESWMWDIETDGSGNPHVLFAKFVSATDHRYMYSKWNGSSWTSAVQITTAGDSLIPAVEPHYSGGISFGREDSSLATAYLSKDDGTTWNIQKWTSGDSGATWSKDSDITSVTDNQGAKQARPVSPWNQPTGKRMNILWWGGAYTNWDAGFNAAVYADPAPLWAGHVKVPSVSGAADTEIFVYYNNSSAVDQENRATALADYHFWYEMEIGPGDRLILDKTGNGFHATADSYSALPRIDGDAEHGPGFDFPKDVDQVAAVDSSFDLASSTAFAVEAIINWDGGGSFNQTILSSWTSSSTIAEFLFRLDPGTSELDALARVETDTQIGGALASPTVGTGAYEHVAAAFNTTNLRAFVGGSGASVGSTGAAMDAGSMAAMQIAKSVHSTNDEDVYDGIISLVRFHSVDRSGDYFTASKNNLLDLATFYTLGTQEVETATGNFMEHVDGTATSVGSSGTYMEAEDGSAASTRSSGGKFQEHTDGSAASLVAN